MVQDLWQVTCGVSCLARALSDALDRRLPNQLVVTVAVGGILAGACQGGQTAALQQLASMALALATLGVFYRLRMVRAGDVKGAGALGAWQGLSLAPVSLLYGCLLAGVWSAARLAVMPDAACRLQAVALRPFDGAALERARREKTSLPLMVPLVLGALLNLWLARGHR